MDKEGSLVEVERNQRQEAREQLITAMLEGQSWQEVSQGSNVPLKRAMAYRLLHAVRIKRNWLMQEWMRHSPKPWQAGRSLSGKDQRMILFPFSTLMGTKKPFTLIISFHAVWSDVWAKSWVAVLW